MGEPIRIDFGTQSSPGRLGNSDTGPRHKNAFVEQIIEGQPALPIYAPSGLDLFATVTDGGVCRGGIVVDSALFAVSGKKLVRMDALGTVTDIAGIPGSSPVFMARNAKSGTPQVAIVADGNAYSLEGNTLRAINDTDLPPPNSVTFLDQRVIYTHDSGRLSWSDIDDVSAVDGTSFATAEGAPDGLVRGFSHRLGVFLFGAESTELWTSTSNTTNPFQRISGGFIPKGCVAPHSVQSLSEWVYWIGNDDIPYRTTGAGLQDIGHGPVCRAIRETSNRQSITSFSYYDGEHGFYVLNGPDWTWQLNTKTGKWFERESYGMTRWRAEFAFRLGSQTIVGDHTNAKYYKINPNTYTENGNALVWMVRSPPMHAFPNRYAVDRFYADFVPGVGLNSSDTDEANPQVGLSYSDDGGHSWSRTRWRSLGRQGHRMTRLVWDGLGVTGRAGRIWELSAAAAVAKGFRYAAIEGDRIGT